MTGQRRTFAPAFKLEVIRMVREQGLSTATVSRTMNVDEPAIRRWLAKHDAARTTTARTAEQLRISQLEQENRQLRGELEALRNARQSRPRPL